MASAYGAPTQNLPTGPRSRTNSLQYPHSYDRPPASRGRSVSPPSARRYSGYNSYSPQSNNYRSDPYWYQDSYLDYGRASPGAPERYGRSYWDSSRERYDQRRPVSPVSPYSRSREPSGSWRETETTATRVFEPSDSWKQSNRDRATSGGSPNRSPQRSYSQDGGNWSSYRYDDDRHYRPSSYEADAPAARGRYDSYRPDYETEGENHRQRSYSRSPYRRHRNSKRSYSSERSKSRSPRYRSRSRSRSRIASRTPSRSRSHSRSRRLGRNSRSLSRSRLRSPSSRSISRSRSRSSRSRSRSSFPKGSSLSRRYIDSEASTPARIPSPSVTQVRSERDGLKRNTNSTEASSAKAQRQLNVNRVYTISSRSASSRSPSHSSIASSRETSVKPSAPAVHGSDTAIASQPTLDIKSATLPSKLDEQCPPLSAGSTVLSQDLKTVGPCSVSNLPPQAEVTVPKSERDRVAEVKTQELPDEQSQAEQILEPVEDPELVPGGEAPTKDGTTEQYQSEAEDIVLMDILPQPSPPPPDKRLVPDFGPEDIPNMSEATSVREALRIVVMTRLLADRQTREERVEPILATNLSLPKFPHEKITSVKPCPEVLMQEMFDSTGKRARSRSEAFRQAHTGLVERFEARQAALKDKVQKLKEEYLSLHEKWVDHCARLDEQAKAKQAVNAAEAPVQPSVLPPATGRTTRRSAATMGDAVRSDFEMEQIIASIGYDEATDPNQLCVRNLAVIPDMISVTNGRVDYVFDDNNLRIDNPAEYYAPDTGIHDWTEEEKQVFMDKFAAYPKQFGMIAKYLPNKTTAQCVDFYYLHKKVSIDFRNVVAMNAPGKKGKRRTGKRKGNALLADIRKHDAEVGPTTRGKGKRTSAATVASLEARKSRRSGVNPEDTPTTATPTPEPESRPRRRRAAGPSAMSGRSSLAIIPNEVDEDATDNDSISRPAKRAKRARKVKSAAIVNDDGFTPPPAAAESDSKNADTEPSGRRRAVAVWSDDDKELFLKLLAQHGDDFKRISASMPNKTTAQVANYYRNHIDELNLREIAKNAPRHSPPPNSRHDSPPMASLTLDDEPTGGDVRSTATSVSVTPAPAESIAGQPVPMHARDLGAMYQGYSGYTTPYGAHATTVPMSVYSTNAKNYHTSGYGAVAYGSYGSAAPGVYPNSAYASTRSAYYPYPYSYSVPAAPYSGSGATPPSASTATGAAANPYADPRYYSYS